MNWLREVARRLRMLVHRSQFDADLEEEMHLHLELRQQEHLESGMTADSARAAARRRFGNVTCLREKAASRGAGNGSRTSRRMSATALRMLRKIPRLHGRRHPHPRSRHRRKHRDIQCDQWSAAQSASLQGSEATRRHQGTRFAPERDGHPETDARILAGRRNQRREDGLHRRNRTCASPCRAHQCGRFSKR